MLKENGLIGTTNKKVAPTSEQAILSVPAGGRPSPTPTKEATMFETARTPFDETAENLTSMILAITTYQTLESEQGEATPEMIDAALLLFSMSQVPAEA